MNPTKSYYRIREVSALLDVPAYTLRYWESVFPMFQPGRTEFGQRRYTPQDLDLAKRIKTLLYDKKMSIDGAVAMLGVSYRKSAIRNAYKCNTPNDALKLVGDVKTSQTDLHTIKKLEAVESWLKTLDAPVVHKNIRGREYYAD